MQVCKQQELSALLQSYTRYKGAAGTSLIPPCQLQWGLQHPQKQPVPVSPGKEPPLGRGRTEIHAVTSLFI